MACANWSAELARMLALPDARLVSAEQMAYDERSRWTSSRSKRSERHNYPAPHRRLRRCF